MHLQNVSYQEFLSSAKSCLFKLHSDGIPDFCFEKADFEKK